MAFSKIDVDSLNTVSTALNFFDIPPTQVSVSSAAFREYLTLNPIDQKPFHFKIHPTSSYIDLSKCFIFTEMQVMKKKGDGTDLVVLEDADQVAPIQMIGATFIKNMKISINGRETYDSNSLHHYKSYLDVELSYPKHVKDSYLEAAGYYSDGTNQIDRSGTGFKMRRALIAGSKVAQFMSKIDADIFNQELYMVNFVIICPVNCEI